MFKCFYCWVRINIQGLSTHVVKWNKAIHVFAEKQGAGRGTLFYVTKMVHSSTDNGNNLKTITDITVNDNHITIKLRRRKMTP